MKKLVVALTILLLSVSAFSGDGADGGGSKHSLWDQLFKGKESLHNPKYADGSNNGSNVVIYADDASLQEISGLEVKRFYFSNDQSVDISEVKMFLVNKSTAKENLSDIKLKDIIGIVVGDEVLLLEHLEWVELDDSGRSE